MDAPDDSATTCPVDALRREWARLQFVAGGGGDSSAGATQGTSQGPAWSAAVVALARQFVAQRSRLFDANATLQAEATNDDDPAMVAQVETNQLAIKTCTTALTEMTAALGRASIPA